MGMGIPVAQCQKARPCKRGDHCVGTCVPFGGANTRVTCTFWAGRTGETAGALEALHQCRMALRPQPRVLDWAKSLWFPRLLLELQFRASANYLECRGRLSRLVGGQSTVLEPHQLLAACTPAARCFLPIRPVSFRLHLHLNKYLLTKQHFACSVGIGGNRPQHDETLSRESPSFASHCATAHAPYRLIVSKQAGVGLGGVILFARTALS